MGRHRSRSRSPRRGGSDRSPEHQRDRHCDDDRGHTSEKHSRRHGSSPRRERHGGDRHRSTRADSPPGGHNSSERRHDRQGEKGAVRGGSSERRELPPPPPHRGRDFDSEAPPPPLNGGKPGKRRSRFDQSPDAAQPDQALPPPPQQQEPPQNEPVDEEAEPEPDFALSGKLAAESNKVNGVVMLHAEPQEAANPQHRWRLYQFKGGKPFQDPLPIHRQSCYLFGRERRVADVPTDHPSCSKQHAVLQFRRTEKEGVDGMMHALVRPYLMDLGSVNGTFVNNERIEGERYYELLEQDMVRFGNSTRDYVLLHEGSSI